MNAWSIACALVLLLPGLALPLAAQPAAGAAKPPAKRPAPDASRVEIRSTASQMASGIAAADAALTPAELEIASRVHTGQLPCELGNAVLITPDAAAPGYFTVQLRAQRYRMFPVVSATGAIRLEDPREGAVWLQLANKSMLMNQRLGRRLADECMSPAQAAVAQALRLNPPRSLLDAPAPAPAVVPAPVAPVPAALPAPPAPSVSPAPAAPTPGPAATP